VDLEADSSPDRLFETRPLGVGEFIVEIAHDFTVLE
jgi:hypothetical protein